MSTKELPLVTVIMPVRNEALYIRRSLGAVLSQEYPVDRLEILVADGMSEDGTRDIVRTFQAQRPNLRLVDNPGKVVPTGFNLALREARGEIIVRVDGHSEIALDYVNNAVEELLRTGADNVGGPVTPVGEGGFGVVAALAQTSGFGGGGGRFHESDREEWVDTVCMGVWRREVFERIGMFDEEMVRDQDDEFNYRLLERGGRIFRSPRVKSAYTVRTTPLSLWRQYFQYGYWKVRVMQKHPLQMRYRQFAPPAFVAALLAFGALAALLPFGGRLLAYLLGVYLVGTVIGSAVTASRHGWVFFPLLPLAYVIMHVSYGLGFLCGLVAFAGRWRKTAGPEAAAAPSAPAAGVSVRRPKFLPFALPELGLAEMWEMAKVIRSGWVTTGPETRQFEKKFADYVGAPLAVAVNSGTAAMHLALEAADLKAGDEVIVPAYTFAATAEVVRYFNAKPVLVDVDARTLNIDPARIEAAITPRTKAVIPVHFAGQPADMDLILDIAKRRGLKVIEDAAHALPARYKGRMVGTLGDATCFSFYATKTITTGEGGMITTASAEWADRCRIMSLHGISRDAWKRYTQEGSWYYEIVAPGFKYNMTDVAAAMGLVQIRKAARMLHRRVEIAERYTKAFSELPELEAPWVSPEVQHAWQLYILRLHLDRLAIDRARFIEELKARNIGASVHFIPLHLHPYYRETYGFTPGDFPVAHREYQRAVSLPIYSRMTNRDAESVINAIREIVQRHRK
jgi:dTDP-4-amino-4,6-dideoxygalactose transaminase/glycosyltransferase involved in cell wall biosynthesis